MIKLSMLRDNTNLPCPFGLSIPFACKNAGDLVDRMAPLKILGPDANEEEIEMLTKANQQLFDFQNKSEGCKYSNSIVGKAVDCTFDTETAGAQSNDAPIGSPFYSKVYQNSSLDGLNVIPVGENRDQNMSRNLYYGIFSLLGSATKYEIQKFSDYIHRLNTNFTSLSPPEQALLREFAATYSNNKELVKTASDEHIDRIFEILNSWKD